MAEPTPQVAWFFGYGSLMWNPGFASLRHERARLEGWHRALCIRSEHWRGTAARPGLVLGLAPGGHCVGRAYAVERACEAEVLAYLDEREQVGVYIYDRFSLPLQLADGTAVQAWCYTAKPDHPQVERELSPVQILDRLRHAQGHGGSNADYVRNTVTHLHELGITEPALEALLPSLDGA